MAQESQPPPAQPGPINVHIDLSGLANLIWQSFLDHLGDVGTAVWQGIRDHMGEIGTAILRPLTDTLHTAAAAVWSGVWGSSANIVTQLPADLTYNFGPYRALAADPVSLAAGGATLALVLLGLRTLLGAMVGRDHVITHVTGRLIPATFAAIAYPVIVVQAINLLNAAATSLGFSAIGDVLAMPSAVEPGLLLAYAVLWLFLIWFGAKLLIRLAYSLFRFLVALVFGPVAIILWAIPQTEWITSFWVREFVGWGATPLLVTACLAMAMPLASGRGGFLAAAAFSIAGLQAAHDLAGLFAASRGGGGGMGPIGWARMAAGAVSGGGAGAAAAAIPANRMTTLADQYGYQ